jgi:hypothetical protein
MCSFFRCKKNKRNSIFHLIFFSQINDPTKTDGENEKSVQIELSKETLNLVLDNFTRIREQLNTLAKRD